MWTSAPIIFLLPLYFNGSRGLFTSSHLYNKGCWPETGILHNKLSLSSKPGNSIIFWTILCVLLHQRSICHDLFTRKNSRRLNNCDTHCTCIGIIEHGPVCYLFMKKLVFFMRIFLITIGKRSYSLFYLLTTSYINQRYNYIGPISSNYKSSKELEENLMRYYSSDIIVALGCIWS